MNELKKMTAAEHAEIWCDETLRKAYNVQAPDYRAGQSAGQIDALRKLDWDLVEQGACELFDLARNPFGDHAEKCRRNLAAIRKLRKELGL